ncbi:DNA-protecting protein DprA [Wenzhouxiangella sp. XN79A]|uniref:DNA-processing protein DprA n=1 Tax=Wenzhouxiangella sp. XN79A TaxID=2724193 RepID=UPI00144AAC1E|nr:DNA-processing protein DprA [Wenzhouxiangella sp. XN79A]NKI35851.1 DNA-protecting protein DprA [Wenzhouxiangella sp. XN79A]
MTADERRRAWLIVHQAPGLGATGLQALIERDIDPATLPGRSRSFLRDLDLSDSLVRALSDPDEQRLAASEAWLDAPNHHLVAWDDPLYPPLLKRTGDGPAALFVNGDPETLVAPQVAIVGSRNATAGGLDIAARFAGRLASAGLVVTSGLAAGIDAAAHRAAIKTGGRTIAVAGTGPDRVYPARHRDLAHEIVDNGCVVTPFAPGVGPRPGHFPARNRIISGMALGCVVVEAGLRSGSLITARLAGEQGREVFAIPGSIHNPVARGCHRLIRDGARLVEEPDEVLEALAPLAGELAGSLRELLEDAAGDDRVDARPAADGDAPDVRAVLDAMGHDPTAVDTIIQRSELTTSAVSSILMTLELDGRVQAHGGGRYSRTATDTERNS